MKKALTIIGLIIIISQSSVAQDESVAGKLLYIELGGAGVVMSTNFDGRFKSNSRLGLGYRIGIGYGSERFDEKFADFMKNLILKNEVDIFSKEYKFTRTFYTFPAGLNYTFGKPNRASCFEIGAGVTLFSRRLSLYNWELEKPGHVIGHLAFMYCLAPVNGGFSFRIGFTPIIGTAGDLFPMGAVGFGYAFN